jgi:outer membrane protein OmpA-like peptidoglycan-associated protein
MRAPWLVVCLLSAITTTSRTASAQSGGDIALDGFRPALDTNGYVTVDGAALTPPAQVAFGLYTTWARGLLRLEGQGARYRVNDAFSPTLVAAMGVPRLPLALGLSLPFGVVAADRDPDTVGERHRTGDQGLGDLGLHAKVGLHRHAALAASVWLPTATDDAWLGAGATSGQLRLIVEGRRGALRGALNAGLRVRAGGAAEYMDLPSAMPGTGLSLSLGAALPVGGAVAYSLSPNKVDVLAEGWALVPLDGAGYAPVEALAGLKVHLARASHLTLGGGVGVGPDAGNPDARAFLAIVFEPGRPERSHVVIPDAPDLPRVVRVEPPPDEPAPETDRDGDGNLYMNDLGEVEAEDFDGLDDADGCPETDADGDQIADVDDRCPTKAETRNGVEDDDGCPDNDLITFTDGGFETLKPIHFEFDSAVIKPESYPVVRAVAEALRTHAHIRRMEIGGHTDSRGSAAYNLTLSRERAAAVKAFLVDDGVDEHRLESEGYGETRPLLDRRTEAAYAQNRRVEFLILDAR